MRPVFIALFGLVSVVFVLSAIVIHVAAAQTTTPDYARAEQFFTWNLDKRIFGNTIDVHWLKDGSRFWYRVKTPRGNEFHIVDPTLNTKKPVFDNGKLAAAMSLAVDTSFEPSKLPFTTFDFGATEQQIEFRAGKRQFKCDVATYRCALGDTLTDFAKSS